MTRDEQKRAVAAAAVEHVEPGSTIGVGTGSTAALFIEQLAARPGLVAGAVPSSEATATALRAAGIPVATLDEATRLPLYVDGADAVDPALRLIKGAGGALTREKVVASASELFVCIVDESKLTDRLAGPTGDHPEGAPVPLAVVPMAVPLVAARVRELGGRPEARAGYTADDGFAIVDVAGLDLDDPERLEAELDAIPGVVECGIFARRRADVVLAGSDAGVRTVRPA
ncbi:MAG TPA: ribose-5-phosphate isomerase RpiA [Thermoleophilia bacterium]|nr:ribose-5-phosphate isomerase RpiA [Thermoleophilia bacterium]